MVPIHPDRFCRLPDTTLRSGSAGAGCVDAAESPAAPGPPLGSLVASLPADFQDGLIDAAALVALRAGDRLFLRGDANDGLYAVLTGGVRFGAFQRTGKGIDLRHRRALALVRRGRLAGRRKTHA